MSWLSSLFHKEKKYEKTVQITIHDYVIGSGTDFIFTQLPSTEYFVNFVEFRIPELTLNNEDRVTHLFSNIGEGKQNRPFDINVNETGKKPIRITSASISDFGKCIMNNRCIIFQNVILTAKVDDVLY